jgi:hypothetical protein
MSSIFETLELCKKLNAGYKPALNNSPVADCTRRFDLLPLRYAAVGGNPGQRARLPQLPDHLRPFDDIGELTQSSYAIRPLREGFLYLLIKRRRQEAHEWHSQYRIAPNGSLLYISADAPWEPIPSAATFEEIVRGFGWAITLYDLDDIEELRPLYSPSPLTQNMLGNYRLLDDQYRATLPRIDIAKFIQPADAPPQPHVLKHDELHYVADFKAQQDPALQVLLGAQPFNVGQIVSMSASHHALKPDKDQIKPRGAAIVIEDAIGITQELNAWRNAAIEDVKTEWLERTLEPGVDNERKLLVAQSFLEVEKLYPDMITEQIIKREVMAETIRLQPQPNPHMELYASDLARQADDEHDARMKPRLEQFERETRARVEARRDAGEFKNKFGKKYGRLVDLPAMHSQLDAFERVLACAQQEADDRANDHIRWAYSERFLQALDCYDPEDLISGLAFAEQTGRCIIGMELCAPGSRLLDLWWRSDPTSRRNIALRGTAANQNDIRDEVAALIDTARTAPPEQSWLELPESMTRQAYAAAVAFGHVNTLYEQLQSQGATPSVGLLAWYTVLGRQVLRTAAPNSADHALHRGLRSVLMASVNKEAIKVRVAEAANSGEIARPSRTGRQARYFLDKAWAEGLMGAGKSDFYKVRVSGLACLLEGLLMAFKAGELPDSDARLKTELFAAAMTTAGAGFEMGASYVEQIITRTGANSVTGRGAELALGRLKLSGAALAGVGGLVLAWWDFSDGMQRHKEGRDSKSAETRHRSQMLTRAYYARALATVTLSAAEIGTATAIAKPLFEYWANTTKNNFNRRMLIRVSKVSGTLGSQIARLLLARIVLGAFWVGLGLTVIIAIIDDDALETWCQHCCYRLDPSRKLLKDEKELSELFSALNEIL